MKKMIISNLNLELLSSDELIQIDGGKVPDSTTSFGNDVGYYLGWILSAMGKGASAIQG